MEGTSDAGSKVKDERSDEDDITIVEDEDEARKREARDLNEGASANSKEPVDREGGHHQSSVDARNAFDYQMQGVLDNQMSPLESRQDSHSTTVDSDVSGFHASMDQSLDQGGWSWNKDSEIILPDMSIIYECEICHKRLSCKSNLGRHIKEQHRTIKHAYSCLQCLAEFRRRCDLRMHYAKRHPDHIYEVESITYEVSRFVGVEMNSGSDLSRDASYLADPQPDVQEVFEVERHSPRDLVPSAPRRTSDIDPFDRHAPTHIIGHNNITTRPFVQRAPVLNTDKGLLYQASGSGVGMESGAIQRILDPAVLGIGNANSLHGRSSTTRQGDSDYLSSMSLMKQMVTEANVPGSSIIGETSQSKLAGKYVESNSRSGAVPPGKRHCPDPVQSVAIPEKANLQIVNVVGSVDIHVEDGENREGRKNCDGKMINADRETQLHSLESRKKRIIVHDSSKSSECIDAAGNSGLNEQVKGNNSQRDEDITDQESNKLSSDLKSGKVRAQSTSAQNQNRILNVKQQVDTHRTLSRQIQKHGKKTDRGSYPVIKHEQRSKTLVGSLFKSINKRKLYLKCKHFAASYEKRMQDSSVERHTFNKNPTTVQNPFSQRANAESSGSRASNLCRTHQHRAVSQDWQSSRTGGAEQEIADQDTTDSTSRETCGTQTDLNLDNNERILNDEGNRETNQPSRVQRVTENSSENASSSNTSLPVLLDHFGPRLTEYEEHSTIEDFGAEGALIRREVTERKYKIEPGNAMSIVQPGSREMTSASKGTVKVRRFQCGICDTNFTLLKNAKRHYRCQHLNYYYWCKYCPNGKETRRYTRREFLEDHFLSHHPESMCEVAEVGKNVRTDEYNIVCVDIYEDEEEEEEVGVEVVTTTDTNLPGRTTLEAASSRGAFEGSLLLQHAEQRENMRSEINARGNFINLADYHGFANDSQPSGSDASGSVQKRMQRISPVNEQSSKVRRIENDRSLNFDSDMPYGDGTLRERDIAPSVTRWVSPMEQSLPSQINVNVPNQSALTSSRGQSTRHDSSYSGHAMLHAPSATTQDCLVIGSAITPADKNTPLTPSPPFAQPSTRHASPQIASSSTRHPPGQSPTLQNTHHQPKRHNHLLPDQRHHTNTVNASGSCRNATEEANIVISSSNATYRKPRRDPTQHRSREVVVTEGEGPATSSLSCKEIFEKYRDSISKYSKEIDCKYDSSGKVVRQKMIKHVFVFSKVQAEVTRQEPTEMQAADRSASR